METKVHKTASFGCRQLRCGAAWLRMSLTLTLLMLMSLSAWADGISYINANGETVTCLSATAITGDTGFVPSTIDDTIDEIWYYVEGETTLTESVWFSREEGQGNKTINIILCDGAILTAKKEFSSGFSLNIYGQGGDTPGEIRTCSFDIPVEYADADLTIYGGKIQIDPTLNEADTGTEGISISGNITVNGGYITIQKKEALISKNGDITINGGTVSITSEGQYGISAENGDVTISGGNVNVIATGSDNNWNGIAIKAGKNDGNLTIKGGTVRVEVGSNTTGNPLTQNGNIGFGLYANNIIINDGNITATAINGHAISGKHISLCGGTVTANATDPSKSVGIFSDDEITFAGATVTSCNYKTYNDEGEVIVADGIEMNDGKGHTYSGKLTDDDIAAIAGKTLTPQTPSSGPNVVVVKEGEGNVSYEVTKNNSNGWTCKLSATPAGGYYIRIENITAQKTVDPGLMGARAMEPRRTDVPVADALEVKGEYLYPRQETTYYTIEIPENYGAYVTVKFVACTPVTLHVTMEDWVVGEIANKPTVMGNDGQLQATYTYAVKGSDDFSEDAPTEVGEYTVKVSTPASGIYLAAEATADFEIKAFTQTISFAESQEWKGYCNTTARDLGLPQGVTAYIITAIGETTATAEPVSYLPQGVPVLLFRKDAVAAAEVTAQVYNVQTSVETASNLLQVAPEGGRQIGNAQVYVLYSNEFVMASAGVVPAGRVYLPISGAAPARLAIVIGEETTAIENCLKPTADTQTDVWYSIDGRKLQGQPANKGVYIYKGKKVIW